MDWPDRRTVVVTRDGISDALASGGRPEVAHARFEPVPSTVERFSVERENRMA
jgi:hypothetical protein